MSNEIRLAFAHPRERSEAMAGPDPMDRISLRDHIVDVDIGAFQTERGQMQRVCFNVVVEVRPLSDPIDDDVDRILSYFGHALILAVLLLLGAVPGIVINVIVGMTSSFLGVIVGIALFVVMVVASYRLSVIMPAAALGRSLPVRRAWEATKGTTLTICGLVLLSFALSFLLQVLIAILSFVLPVVGGLISVVVSCFTSLLGLSIMTTMYGVYIEGRSLD